MPSLHEATFSIGDAAPKMSDRKAPIDALMCLITFVETGEVVMPLLVGQLLRNRPIVHQPVQEDSGLDPRARPDRLVRGVEGPPSGLRPARSLPKIQRQAHIVFGHGARTRFAVDQVVEFGVLELLADVAVFREVVHQAGEPPAEALCTPYAAQAAL